MKLVVTREAEIVEELAPHLNDRYKELHAGSAADEQTARAVRAELSERKLSARSEQPR